MKKFFERIKAAFVAEGRFSPAITAVLLAILIAGNGIVYALTNYFGLYLHASDLESVALSQAPDTLFKELKQKGRKVEILFCMSEDELAYHDTGAFVQHTAKQMAERYADVVTVKYLNLLTHIDSDRKNRSAEIEEYKKTMVEGEVLRTTSVVFTYTSASGQKSYRVLTDNTDIGFASFFMMDAAGNALAYQGEELLSAMSVLSTDKTAKNAYFTQYHGEIVDVSLTTLLSCAGYNINVLNLRDAERVPEDCDLLVISAPQTDFEKAAEGLDGVRTEIERLTTYVENGGHLFVTTHSYLKNPLTNFDAFLAGYGIETVKNADGVTCTVKDGQSSIPTDAYTLVADYAEGDFYTKLAPRLSGRGGVVLTDTAALSLSKNAKPLLVSSSSASLEAAGKGEGSGGLYHLAAMTEVKGGGDIVVVPSVYLTASDAMVSNTYSNRSFVYGVIEVLYGGESLPYGCRAVNLMTDMLENLTARAARLYTAVIFLIPAALSVFGFVYLRRRRNR